MPMKSLVLLLSLASAGAVHGGPETGPPAPSIRAQSAAEEAASFQLPAGYHLQLALGDSEIKEHVVTVFDGNGRMFAAEMRTYIQDIDGNGQRKATSRISMHVDINDDGTSDKLTVFADHLLLPQQARK